MSDLHDDINRAEHARRLLSDQLLQDALAAIHEGVTRAWIDCPQRDKEGKEALWQLAKTADKFKALLTGYIEAGKLAADQLKRYEKDSLLRRAINRI